MNRDAAYHLLQRLLDKLDNKPPEPRRREIYDLLQQFQTNSFNAGYIRRVEEEEENA
jgi:hypothetical protein